MNMSIKKEPPSIPVRNDAAPPPQFESVAEDSLGNEATLESNDKNTDYKRRKQEAIEKRPVPNLDNIKSKVYKHFDWMSDIHQWCCKYCPRLMNHAVAGGGGNLRKHLQSHHANLAECREVLDEPKEKSLQKEKSLPKEKSLQTEKSLQKEKYLPKEKSLPTEKSMPTEKYLPTEKSLPREKALPKEKSLPTKKSLPKIRTSMKRKSDEQVRETPKNEATHNTVTPEMIGKLVLDLIVEQNLPFSIVDSPELWRLISCCFQENPKTKLQVDHNTITQNIIANVCRNEHRALAEELRQTSGKISFTIDGWTIDNQVQYQGIVASWVDENWKHHNCVLDCVKLDGFLSGENIANAFSKTLEDFGLSRKLLAVTTEDASNMDIFLAEVDAKYGQSFKSNNCRVRCFAQIINRTCKTIISCFSAATCNAHFQQDDDNNFNDVDDLDENTDSVPVSNTIFKLRRVVAAICDSTRREDKLKEFCTKHNVNYTGLNMAVRSTSWNSILTMLVRTAELKAPLVATLAYYPELYKFRISEEEWGNIKKLIEILKPFKDVTITMLENQSVTISETAAVHQFLFDHLEKYTQQPKLLTRTRKRKSENTNSNNNNTNINRDAWLAKAAKRGRKELEKYYPTSDGLVSIVATVMDPRCKLQYFKGIGWNKKCMESAKQAITVLWNTRYITLEAWSSENNEEANASATNINNKLFQKMYERTLKMYNIKDDDELSQYLSEPIVNPRLLEQQDTQGPLGWWKAHESKFPQLANMARDFLAVPGIAVSLKPLFLSKSSGCGGGDTTQTVPYGYKSPQTTMCLKPWIKRKQSDEFQKYVMKAIREKILGDDDCHAEEDCVELTIEDNITDNGTTASVE